MEIWTNGTVTPQMALVEGAKILRKHLNPFIQYAEPGPEMPIEDRAETGAAADAVDHELERKLNMSLAELELSVRATNCLESEGITTVRDLVIRTDEELLEVRNFGETTLKEVKSQAGRARPPPGNEAAGILAATALARLPARLSHATLESRPEVGPECHPSACVDAKPGPGPFHPRAHHHHR